MTATTASVSGSRVDRRTAVRWATATIVALAILLLNGDRIALLVGPNRSVLLQATVTGLLIGGVYSLVSMGLTLIYGVLHIINFAHGALMTIGMYTSFLLVARTGLDPYASIVVVVALLFLFGAVIQKFLLNPIMDQSLEKKLLLTLGLSIFIENLLLVLFTPTPKAIQLPYGQGMLSLGLFDLSWPFRPFGAVATLSRTLAFVGALALAGLLYLLLQRTRFGTAIRAVADNPRGAAIVGVNVERTYLLTFGLGTACVGAAATLVLPFLSLEPTTGDAFNIIAFVVVVLGGMGNVIGALLGGILIGLTQQIGGVVFPGQSNLLGVFILFVLALYLRPDGLLGKAKA
ncbi:MAG: branched-chain amino acid ABC transporter permease [Nitriliruptoraceae bacterium]